MKRNIICIFVLIFWGLVICTILSICIEQQMTAQVTVIKTNPIGQSEIKLPVDCVIYRNEEPYFYEVVMGRNWENGKRAEEVELYRYRIEEDGIYVDNASELGYIQYTSKAITSGEQIEVVSPYKGKQENYLIILSDEIEGRKTELIEKLKSKGEIVQQDGEIVLLSMMGKKPYIEAQVKSTLSLSKTDRVYCLEQICIFFENIPLVSGLLVILVISIILWIYSCILSQHLQKNKFCLIGNFGVGILLIFVFVWITKQICLPSSLLPQKNIFELQHYKNEFLEIFRALESLSGKFVLDIKTIFWKNSLLAAGIFLSGLIGCTGILYLEQKKTRGFSNR